MISARELVNIVKAEGFTVDAEVMGTPVPVEEVPELAALLLMLLPDATRSKKSIVRIPCPYPLLLHPTTADDSHYWLSYWKLDKLNE